MERRVVELARRPVDLGAEQPLGEVDPVELGLRGLEAGMRRVELRLEVADDPVEARLPDCAFEARRPQETDVSFGLSASTSMVMSTSWASATRAATDIFHWRKYE